VADRGAAKETGAAALRQRYRSRMGAKSACHLLILTLLGLAVAWILAPSNALACSCVGFSAQDLPKFDAVVIGRLEKQKVDPIPGSTDYGPADFTYTVREAFGPEPRLAVGEVFKVRTHTSGAACGIPGKVGKSRGLLLDRHNHRWRSSLCTSAPLKKMRRLAAKAFGDGAGKADSPKTRSRCGLSPSIIARRLF
jgi:hypothetical protein